jgi:transposase
MRLVPGQHSTGGKARLFGISKRDNSYLRNIFVHGGAWLDSLELRAPINVVITAAANKLARNLNSGSAAMRSASCDTGCEKCNEV